jgi:fatty acid synthase subunit alpha
MKATSSAVKERSMGRTPREACRPCTDTRGGFMEAQGAGIQLLMSARLALDMGCPIFAVVGLVNTATDKEGRSVPAPGQGILTTARETKMLYANPLLKLEYRQRRMARELHSMRENLAEEKRMYEQEAAGMTTNTDLSQEAIADFVRERLELNQREEQRAESAIRSRWTNDYFLNEPTIAPLRGALSVWGLTVDDIAVASFHGTGTTANDINESKVTNMQMEHLGRKKGNPLMVVCQKWLTGHPKGAAAAWMTNGLIQAMTTGKVPGNRNADNIDGKLAQYEHLMYPNRSMHTTGINAAMLKSFGFGQAGAEILLVHPKFLYATLGAEARAVYGRRRGRRHIQFMRSYQKMITGKEPLVKIKHRAPYTEEQQNVVYLNPRYVHIHFMVHVWWYLLCNFQYRQYYEHTFL